jgi:hypothetical protein
LIPEQQGNIIPRQFSLHTFANPLRALRFSNVALAFIDDTDLNLKTAKDSQSSAKNILHGFSGAYLYRE